MKQLMLVLALALALQGCVLLVEVPYELGKAVVNDLRAGKRHGVTISPERRSAAQFCERTYPDDIAACMARNYDPEPEKAFSEKRESSPWNPKGMAPGSCGAAYICDD